MGATEAQTSAHDMIAPPPVPVDTAVVAVDVTALVLTEVELAAVVVAADELALLELELASALELASLAVDETLVVTEVELDVLPTVEPAVFAAEEVEPWPPVDAAVAPPAPPAPVSTLLLHPAAKPMTTHTATHLAFPMTSDSHEAEPKSIRGTLPARLDAPLSG
jgi:hypothetical protein